MALVSSSEFARLSGCSRQNISNLLKKDYLVKNGKKLDTENPINKDYIENKLGGNKKSGVRKEKARSREKDDYDYDSVEVEVEVEVENTVTHSSASTRRELEIKKLTAQVAGLELKNSQTRGELVAREALGDTVYGYLSAMNQNAMNIPEGIVDEFEAAMKSKKTRAEKINILVAPICEMIKETKQEVIKTIDKARREAVKDSE